MNMVGTGISRTISMSNTMKIIASKKNRMENGIRAILLGSNPHSNGVDFSRSSEDRALRIHAANRTTIGISAEILNITEARFIN